MHEMKEGKLKSGRSGKTVKNPKQAIAIGLSEARESGSKVPKKKGAKKGAKTAKEVLNVLEVIFIPLNASRRRARQGGAQGHLRPGVEPHA